MSPANCLATNPEAMQTALDSGGASLVEGARLFLADLAKGRISMSDDQAFEVGRNLATTPGSVVFENELMQLIQYTPSTAKVHKRPLVIVPPCINKFYILDLQPDNSLVAYAVAQGHTVFLVSWRNVGAAQGQLGWDDYVEQGVLQALAVARKISRADRVNTLGFCIGGTLLASALAVAAARGEAPAASVTLLTTMLDFSDTGELGLMVDEAIGRQARGQHRQRRPAARARTGAGLRRAARQRPDLALCRQRLPEGPGAAGLRPAVLERRRHQPAGPDVLLVPAPDLPREPAARARRHRAVRRAGGPGAHRRAGVRLRLARGPHRALADRLRQHRLLGGDTTLRARRQRPHRRRHQPARQAQAPPLGRPLRPDAAAWLDAAQQVEGSWWPAWTDWLRGHAGALVAAPRQAGNAEFPVIEPAPGRYVKDTGGLKPPTAFRSQPSRRIA